MRQRHNVGKTFEKTIGRKDLAVNDVKRGRRSKRFRLASIDAFRTSRITTLSSHFDFDKSTHISPVKIFADCPVGFDPRQKGCF